MCLQLLSGANPEGRSFLVHRINSGLCGVFDDDKQIPPIDGPKFQRSNPNQTYHLFQLLQERIAVQLFPFARCYFYDHCSFQESCRTPFDDFSGPVVTSQGVRSSTWSRNKTKRERKTEFHCQCIGSWDEI